MSGFSGIAQTPLTRNWGEPLDVARERRRFIESMPLQFRRFLQRKHKRDVESIGYSRANWELLQYKEQSILKNTGLNAASTVDEIKEYSEHLTRRLERDFLAMGHSAGTGRAFSWIVSEVHIRGVKFPCDLFEASKNQRVAALARVFDPAWWKRGLLRLQRFMVEHIARRVGMVAVKTSPYASRWAVDRREEQKARNLRILESLEMVNADNPEEAVNLLDCVNSSVANPVNRRHELMTRIAGFEQYADWLMHEGAFFTFTCPSKFHCQHSRSGQTNKKYNGTTPKEAQEYLCRQWAKVRAHLHRNNINVYGFRVAEPHHDGTPHWHMLLFMRHEDRFFVYQTMHRYALEVDSTERGAKKNRFDYVAINRAKGSAAGYIAKYIAKNIDGAHVEYDDETGAPANQSALHVDAWASCWGIRQFQQIGGPSVTLWRELRKLSSEEVDEYANIDSDEKSAFVDIEKEELKKIWSAADSGDWADYCVLMGGVDVKRSEAHFKLWRDDINYRFEIMADFNKADPKIEGGVLDDFEPDDLYLHNRYGEVVRSVVGVAGVYGFFKTRLKKWIVKPAKGGDFEGADAPPWSSVNNCTEQSDGELLRLDFERGAG